MVTPEDESARYHLNRALLDDNQALYASHPWFWEGARWVELLFCIAVRICGTSDATVRSLVSELDALNVLQVEGLAILPRNAQGQVDEKASAFKAIAETMARYGIDGDVARRTVTAFADAAKGLAGQFDGEIQKYLRQYGERMLVEVGQHFHFTQLDDAAVRSAFTEWLQNCLAMPLSLRDTDTDAFCRARGISVDALIAAADLEDINLAYLDDITQGVLHAAEPPADEPMPVRAAGQAS